MATHDYVLANQSGSAFRSDLNNALSAIVSQNSSATEPATTFAYQYWVDITPSPALLKQRNAANDAWITLAEIGGQVLLADGTNAKPGLSFASDTDTGFKRNADDDISLVTGGNKRLTVKPDGDVGIGTDSPNNALHVVGTGRFEDSGTALNIHNATETIGFIGNDSGNLSINAGGTNDVMLLKTGGTTRIKVASTGVTTFGDDTNPLPTDAFKVTADVNNNNMVIFDNKRTVGGYARINFRTAGTPRGSIEWETGNVSYLTSSDYRLKENVVSMSQGIEKVKLLNPCTFNFIGDSGSQGGFIAHEVQDVVSYAVAGDKDAVNADGTIEPQSIELSRLVPVLTTALKEAIAKIETLETKVAALEAAN
jgi:hypothetical protein